MKTRSKDRTRKGTIKLPCLHRSVELSRAAIDEDARTVELSFSSEEAVERFFGDEILDHGKSSIRLSRLEEGGPLLMDHNHRDQVGVIQDVSIVDRKGRAVVRFGKGARASEIFQDVIDGIRSKISVGYRVHKMVLEETGDDREVYRVTDWEPLEISIVSVPADATVGIGRDDEGEGPADVEIVYPQATTTRENPNMEDEFDSGPTEPTTTAPGPQGGTRAIDEDRVRSDAMKSERPRISDLQTIGRNMGCEEVAARFVEEGRSTSELLAELRKRRPEDGRPAADQAPTDDGSIGLSDREKQRFSFVRLINALSDPGNSRVQQAAGFELEVCRTASDETVKREIREVRSDIVLPHDILSQPITQDRGVAEALVRMLAQRDLVVGTNTAGGHLVATDLLAQSFIDILRNRAVMMGLGTVLNDLQGNIALPRQTAAVAGTWLSTEQGAATEDDAAFDQVSLSPKEVGVFQEYSRQLLIQSSIDVEAFVRMDLALGLALAIDLAAINADGTNGAPTGILNVSGIGAVAIGANGGAITWPHVVDLETEVAVDNADLGRLGYLTNAAVRGQLKQTEKFSGGGIAIMGERGAELNGYNASISNQVPSDGSKGSGTNLSSMIFGNFADLLIGLWSGVDLLVNPYTGDTTRTTRVTAYQDADIAVRHPESFAAITDIDTAA